jgi:HK97 family phage major capsid protein
MISTKAILEAKQERANIYEGIKAIVNEFEGKEIDAVKKDELTKLENQFDNLNGKIMSAEKNLERERIVSAKEQELEAPKTKADVEVTKAFENWLRDPDPSSMKVYNAIQQDNPTQAGYLVAPQTFVSEVIKELDNSFFFRQKAKVLPALKGAQSLGYPKRTARMARAAWGTELQAPTPDTALTFGKREFKPIPLTAEILVSKTLMRNAPNADGIVKDELAFAYGEALEMAYMTGNGAGQPLGIFTASADGISTSRDIATGNTATEIKFDGLYEAKYAIKQQYQPKVEWIFHRDGVKQIAKIKDGDGQYIWQPSVIADQPDRLMGKTVNMSEYAPNTFTAGLYVGFLGDLSYYWIVDSLNMELQVLNELYARTNQIDYIGRMETDGMPVLEECFARVRLA